MPFKKGQSGNPGGRPKADKRLKELAREKTELALNTLIAIAENGKESASARVAAANAILDRGWGKPTQAVVGDPEQPIAGITRVIVSPGETLSAEAWQQKHGSGKAAN